MRAIARPTIATLMMALVLLLANLLLGNQPDIAVVGLSLVVGLPVYLGMWALMPGGMQILRDLSGYITLILIKKPFEA